MQNDQPHFAAVQSGANSHDPRVSVIVRSMDRPTLFEALESVAAQTWSNIEIVVVDARGQGHGELPKLSGNIPVRLISRGRPLARSEAANVGLDEALGDFLCFLDDDDLFMPDHISNLLSVLTAEPGFLAAYSGVRVEVYGAASKEPERVFDFNQDYSRATLRGRNYIPMHAALFSRNLTVEHGCKFDERFHLFEDWDFWLQLCQYTDFLHDRESVQFTEMPVHPGWSTKIHLISRPIG